MGINLIDILNYSGLKSAKAIAGISGLNRNIQKISVYDRDFVDDIKYDEGILYISSLPHLRECSNEKKLNWFKRIINCGACGLLLVEETTAIITEDIISFCNSERFPIILLDNDFTYADIIEHISILVYYNRIATKNEERLHRIVYEKLSEEEILEAVHAICPGIGETIVVLAVKGKFLSELYERELIREINANTFWFFVPFEDYYILTISGTNKREIEKKKKGVLALIKSYFKELHIGESETFNLVEFDKAIKDGLKALEIAILKNSEYEKSDPISDYALVLSAKKSPSLCRFYQHIVGKIQENDSNDKMEYLQCIRSYVDANGDFSLASKRMQQSESTLRYRINKVKTILGFENDTIKFHEIISLFVIIEKIVKE